MIKLLCPTSCLLAATALFLVTPLEAAPLPLPANIRTIVLPAEVLFTWDASAGADYYKVYRGGPDRRWVPLPPVTEPRFRDTDFLPLPGYYAIGAFNNGGETAVAPEFLVSSATPNISLIGVTPRPMSDTSFAVAWTINGPQPFAGYGRGGGGDGMLEVGPGLEHMTLVGSTSTISERHEFIAQNLQPNTTYYYRLTSAGTNNAGFTYWNTFTTRSFTPPAPVLVSVSSPNPSFVTDEDMPVDFTLVSSNPDGSFVELLILDAPFGIVWGTGPTFTYLSNPEHGGVDYIDVFYFDGMMAGTVRILIMVNHVEDPPIAQDMSLSFIEDGVGKFFVRATGWDFDPNQVECEIVAGPTNGVLTRPLPIIGPPAKLELQYVPNTNFSGIDHFTYRCFDNDSTGNVATVRIYVQPVNDTPIALNQSVTVTAGVPQSITLTASDPDADPLLFQIVNNPAHGTLSGPMPNLVGEYTYTPAAGYTGPDSFTYWVNDPSGATAAATVSINVLPPPPPAAPDSLTAAVGPRTAIDLNWADNSSNEDGFTIERSLSATSGWTEIATVGPNVSTYTSATGQKPNKTYYFRVRAFDLSGPSDYSNTASAKAKN
jgi:hypothetical protein